MLVLNLREPQRAGLLFGGQIHHLMVFLTIRLLPLSQFDYSAFDRRTPQQAFSFQKNDLITLIKLYRTITESLNITINVLAPNGGVVPIDIIEPNHNFVSHTTFNKVSEDTGGAFSFSVDVARLLAILNAIPDTDNIIIHANDTGNIVVFKAETHVVFFSKSKEVLIMNSFRLLRPDEIEIRVGQVSKDNARTPWYSLLLYKDARCDMSILDETVGPSNWTRTHKELKDVIYCTVSVRFPIYEDVVVPETDINGASNLDPDTGKPILKTVNKLVGYTDWASKEDCGTESNTEKEKRRG